MLDGTQISTRQMAELIRDSWQTGRQIIPIVGAGCSADAGVPTVGQLMNYLGHYRSYVDDTRYLPSRDENETNVLLQEAHALAAERYRGKTVTIG
jgi:NAD-dependent SIR2 family protein deacetylase